MTRRNLLAPRALTVIALATCTAGAAFGASGDNWFDPTPNYRAEPPPSNGLLQSTMRKRGWGGDWLEEHDLKLTGYVEGGWNYNFQTPPGGNNGTGRLFDDKSSDPKLDQMSIELKRMAAWSADRFDTGFDVQVIYGADARYTQANGTNFYGSGYGSHRNTTFLPFDNGQLSPVVNELGFPGQEFPENQIDILQANMTFNLPVGNGLQLTGGKFVTPWGIEHIDPTKNLLYSHSYIFSVSTPKTLTGVTAAYQLSDEWHVMGGIVVGWDQSLEDNNDSPSVLAQVGYRPNDDWLFVLTTIFGPEQPDQSESRFMIDMTATWQASEEITIALEGMFGYEPDTSFNRGTIFTNSPFLTFIGDDSTWVGAAAYAEYKWNKYLTFAARGEFFNDGDGEWLIGTEVFSASGGVIIRPFPNHEVGRNLTIRPELRYDYSNDKIFDGLRRNNQLTLGADVIFAF